MPMSEQQHPTPHRHGDHEHGPDHADHGDSAGHADHTGHAGHGLDAGHDHGHGHHDGHGHHGHGDHDDHSHHDPAMFRSRFWVTLVLAVPLIATNDMIMERLGYDLDFYGRGWLGPVLGSIVYFWGGRPFLEGAVHEARAKQPGMMLLITLAITVAWGASMATSLGFLEMDLWWELAALVTVMLLGHWLEMDAVGRAQGALGALAELLPDEAERLDGDEPTVVPIASLDIDDIVLVRPGGRVPADGRIIDGTASLDESMITGESEPVAREVGDRVVAGTIATDSPLRVRVEAVGADTALAGIERLVAEAQEGRSRAQALADRFAALLFYVAVGAAAVTFVVWWAIGDVGDAVDRTVSVLVIACPHALGLAIPLVIAISTALAARSGILVRDRLALERMRTVEIVLFDKTGTLTRGEHVVTDVAGIDLTDAELLALAGGVESTSEHPLARAIVAAAGEHDGVAAATGNRSMAGRGVEATIDGSAVAVGGPALLRERNLSEPEVLAERTETWVAEGASVLHVIRDGEVVGAIGVRDEIRPEARRAVEELKRRGVDVALITGDARRVAEAVAAELGIDDVFAEVLPEDKDRAVMGLQEGGRSVAMVGDGVNDAPALARADVGIAIGAGTDVAIESADVVLATSDPSAVVGVIRLSEATYRKMIQNLAWAAGYNVIAIPLAAGVLAWAGIAMPPWVAALLMSMSTIVVALNAQLLRRTDLGT